MGVLKRRYGPERPPSLHPCVSLCHLRFIHTGCGADVLYALHCAAPHRTAPQRNATQRNDSCMKELSFRFELPVFTGTVRENVCNNSKSVLEVPFFYFAKKAYKRKRSLGLQFETAQGVNNFIYCHYCGCSLLVFAALIVKVAYDRTKESQ